MSLHYASFDTVVGAILEALHSARSEMNDGNPDRAMDFLAVASMYLSRLDVSGPGGVDIEDRASGEFRRILDNLIGEAHRSARNGLDREVPVRRALE
jgi:hypothetical protein